jgi:uncharacterized protein (TIGR03086 family)
VADGLTLLPAALDAWTRHVHAVPAERWAAPSPAERWTVRDVVNHVTAEHLWAPHLLRGESLAAVGDRYDGNVLGDDPVTAWDAAQRASREAFGAAAPQDRVELSAGDTPAEEYAEQMLLDLVVHGWDLARGAGLDGRAEPALAGHVLQYAGTRRPQWEGSGLFAPQVATDSGDPTDRLVALLGRDPGWRPPAT